MAVVLDRNQEDQDQNNQNQGLQSSGESSQISSAPVAQGAAPAARQPSTSGRFTNLSKYIAANNPSDLTNKVSARVGEVKEKAQTDLSKSKQQFQSEAAATGQAVSAARQGAQQAIQNIQGSGDFNVSDEQFGQGLGQLQAAKNLQYAGPQGLSNEQNLVGQAQQLQSIGDATKTGGGRFALLQKFFNRPTYAAGQQNLDNLLLGANNRALGDVRRTARSFGTDLSQSQQQARSQVAGLQGDVTATQQEALARAQELAAGSEADLGSELDAIIAAEAANRASPNAVAPANFQLTGAYAPMSRSFGSQELYDYHNLPGTTTNKPLEFKVDPGEMADVFLNADEGVRSGLFAFNSGLNNLDLSNRQALIGRANTAQASQLNQLRALLGQEGIQSGEQLRAGNYALDAAKQDELNRALANELAMLGAADNEATSKLIKDSFRRVNLTPQISGLSYDKEAVKRQLIDQARKNVLAKYLK